MTHTQWEMMLNIYQYQIRGNRASKNQCNKNILNSLISRRWVKEFEDGTIEVTQLGLEKSEEEITALYS